MVTKEQITDAKSKSIVAYLSAKGIEPYRITGGQHLYFSPFRSEAEPSFYVRESTGQWHDFGGDKGDIIRLCMALEKCGFIHAVKSLLGLSLSLSGEHSNALPQREKVTLLEVKEITSFALVQYLHQRHIRKRTAKAVGVKECLYTVGDREKPFYSLYFPNVEGGAAVRNGLKNGKRSFAPNTYSLVKGVKPVGLNLFEGWFDFLAALEHNRLTKPNYDTVILNSLSNIKKALPLVKQYQLVNAYFDRDRAGFAELRELKKEHQMVIDRSNLYEGHKDFSEWWEQNSPEIVTLVGKEKAKI